MQLIICHSNVIPVLENILRLLYKDAFLTYLLIFNKLSESDFHIIIKKRSWQTRQDRQLMSLGLYTWWHILEITFKAIFFISVSYFSWFSLNYWFNPYIKSHYSSTKLSAAPFVWSGHNKPHLTAAFPQTVFCSRKSRHSPYFILGTWETSLWCNFWANPLTTKWEPFKWAALMEVLGWFFTPDCSVQPWGFDIKEKKNNPQLPYLIYILWAA